RILIQENENTIGFTLAGRLVGPWAAELDRAWKESLTRLNGKKLSLDLRDVTYSDVEGKRVLREMFNHSQAEFITHSDWSHHLADEIRNFNGVYARGRS
ncbi:MAG TPA: hypothetical protein VGJ21_05290, partial [Terracidiphilus sp.]